MANRRCFSQSVIESDLFLDLPFSAQALYFHLCLSCDDDGFIGGTRKVCGMIGATPEDVQALIDNGFIIVFKSKVACDRFWTINNTLRNDRYKPTIYRKEKSMLYADQTDKDGKIKSATYEIKAEFKNCVLCPSYGTDTNGIPTVYQTDTNGIPLVAERLRNGCEMGNLTELNLTELNLTELSLFPSPANTEQLDRDETSPENNISNEVENLRELNPDLDDDRLKALNIAFNEIFNAYPCKERKQEAKKQFFKLNPYNGVILRIFNAISYYKETGKTFPLFKTFLIEKRWQDGT